MVYLSDTLEGKSPNSSQSAEEITSNIDQATKVALDKRKAQDAGRNNLDALVHNTHDILAFQPRLMANDVQQLPSYLDNIAKETIKDGVAGLQHGGVINGLIGAVKGATTGITTGLKNDDLVKVKFRFKYDNVDVLFLKKIIAGYERAYAGVLGGALRQNKEEKDSGLSTDHAK